MRHRRFRGVTRKDRADACPRHFVAPRVNLSEPGSYTTRWRIGHSDQE